ncbi:MAG: hypothetical protein IJA86_08035 [Clostridia bacterium]|nr:hypothetical protein [Clostridia bacterium]
MDTLQNDQNRGKLVVRVSAASGAVPIPNATVIVRSSEQDAPVRVIGVLTTDESGLTVPLFIATPPLSESLSPGGKQPFSEISAEISAEGYLTSVNINIPIYPGITSIQPVNLIPLPDSGIGTQPSESIVFQNDAQRPNL